MRSVAMHGNEAGALLQQGPSDDDAAPPAAATGGRFARVAGAALAAAGVAAVLVSIGGRRGLAEPKPGDVIGLADTSAPAAVTEALDAVTSPEPARICTDGWDFDFTAAVEYTGTGSGTLIEADTGALALDISSDPLVPGVAELKVTLETLSFGSMTVTKVAPVDELKTIQVSKDFGSLCVSYAPTPDTEALAENKQCAFRPAALPDVAFQAAPLGALKIVPNDVSTVTDIVQTTGKVPVSFVVTGAAFEETWKSEADWKALSGAAKDALAFAAGEGALVTTVSPVANVGGGVLFQGSVLAKAEPAAPCQVQAAIETAVKDGTFQAAVADRVAAAKVKTSGTVGSTNVVTPGVPMKCGQVACRFSDRRAEMADAKCLGAACATSCCEKAWSKEPLPYTGKAIEAAALGLPAGREAAAPEGFKWTGLPKVEAEPAEVPPAVAPGKATAFFAHLPHPVGEVFTDGATLSVDVKLSLAPDAFGEKQTVMASEHGAIELTALTTGKLFFEASLISGRKCAVESEELHLGAIGAMYNVRLSKDMEECCIETTKLPSLGISKKTCSPKDEAEDHFQLHFAHKLSSPKDLSGITVKGVSQEGASMTMSMSIVGLSLEKLRNSGSLEKATEALKQAIAFAAGVGVKASQVTLAFSHSGAKISPFKVHAPRITHAEERSRRHGAAKLEAVLAGMEKPKDEAEDAAVDPVAEKRHEEEWKTEQLFAKLEAAFEKKGKQEPAKAPATVSEGAAAAWEWRRLQETASVSLQVTISDCNAACASMRDSLYGHAANGYILDRLERVTGDGAEGRGTVASMTVAAKHCPAEPVTCGDVTCGEFKTNVHPERTCFGGHCEEVCCEYAKCKDFDCGEDLVPNFMHRHHKCENDEDCLEKCCLQKCSDYECSDHGEGVCTKPFMHLALVPPLKAKEMCCEQRNCCHACTTWCASCLSCMSEKTFCKAEVYSFLDHSPRRLREASSAAVAREEPIAPRASNVSVLFPDGLSAEALAEKERAAAESVASHVERLRAEERRLSEEGAPSARRLKAVRDRLTLLESLQEKKDEKVALYLANAHRPGSTRSVALGGKWDAAVEKAMHGDHPPPLKGCIPSVNVPCEYKLTSVFLHHRGCGLRPKAVNTVAVLTDTTHAVSCGDDAICYVWDIKSGCAHQAFFADDPANRGPVHTVSVMEDAAFILSAGATADGEEGVALIWDWIHGVEKTDFGCGGGPFKSSADVPVTRFSLLGCSDGWTTMWDWGGGADLQLPYYKRTLSEIIDAIKGRLESYYKSNWNGWQRWAYSEHMKTKEHFKEFIMGLNWEMDLDHAFWEAIDKYYDLEIMGSINGISYIRPKQRFVTAGGDGKIRFWDSDSGKQIWASFRLGAAQNAVAGLPTNPLRAVSGGDDGVARLWNLEKGIVTRRYVQVGVDAPIRAVAVFPGGKKVAIGYDDGYVRIFSIYKGHLSCSIYTGSAVHSLAINPSNPLGQIIVAGADGYVHVYDPHKGYKV